MRFATGLTWLLLAGVIAAQVTSPPPVCFGFNEAAPATAPGIAVTSNGLVIGFTAATTATIERVEIWTAAFVAYSYSIDVFATPALGAPPTGPSIGHFGMISPVPFGTNGWATANATVPAPLVAGSTYAVRFVSVSPTLCTQFFFAAAGPSSLPFQAAAAATCGSIPPPSGSLPFKIRFRGTSCGPGPPASVGPLGSACGFMGIGAPSLTSSTPPVLGGSFQINVSSANAGGAAMLYWSVGVNPAGAPIAAGSPCLCHLDLASVWQLNQLGLEPLAVTVIPTPSFPAWTFAVPALPAYAGVVIGAQAAIFGPNGTIPLGGTVAEFTNALQLTLGY
jgi:hypothetical protein